MSKYRTVVLPFLKEHPPVTPFTNWLVGGTQLELKELGRQLRDYEDLYFLSPAKINLGTTIYLVAVTSERLMMIQKGLIGDRQVVTIPLEKIADYGSRRKFFKGEVAISTVSSSSFLIGDLWWTDTENLIKALEMAKSRRNHGNLSEDIANSILSKLTNAVNPQGYPTHSGDDVRISDWDTL